MKCLVDLSNYWRERRFSGVAVGEARTDTNPKTEIQNKSENRDSNNQSKGVYEIRLPAP
jgi:hypothetical protein